jgi:hypothetical protein
VHSDVIEQADEVDEIEVALPRQQTLVAGVVEQRAADLGPRVVDLDRDDPVFPDVALLRGTRRPRPAGRQRSSATA